MFDCAEDYAAGEAYAAAWAEYEDSLDGDEEPTDEGFEEWCEDREHEESVLETNRSLMGRL